MQSRNAPCSCGSGKKYKHCCGGAGKRDFLVRIHDAMALHRAGRLIEALPLYRNLVREAPEDGQLRNLLGTVLLQMGEIGKAEEELQRSVRLEPLSPLGWNNLGLVHMERGRWKEAVAAFRRATEVDAAYSDAWNNLGNALDEQKHHLAALEAYRRAHALAPGDNEIRENLASAELESGHYEEAERQLQGLLHENPRNSRAAGIMGRLLCARGQFEEGEHLLRAALAERPAERFAARYWLAIARSRRLTSADDALVRELEGFVASLSEANSDLHFALGKIYDDLGRYEEAFSHYRQANEIERERYPFDVMAFTRKVDAIIQASGSRVDSHCHGASELPVLIVGMPRSGTTLVEQILSSHPQIYGAGELPFWNEKALAMKEFPSPPNSADQARLGQEYLQKLRELAPEAARVTDKMPHNFLYLGLILQCVPGARIIHCLRDPVDTGLSIYFQSFGSNQAYSSSLEAIASHYLDYRRLMTHWKSVLPADRLMEIRYEDIVDDLETGAKRLIQFCGLPWDEACLDFNRTSRAVLTASQWQVRQPIYKTSKERWRNYEPWIGPLLELLKDDDDA